MDECYYPQYKDYLYIWIMGKQNQYKKDHIEKFTWGKTAKYKYFDFYVHQIHGRVKLWFNNIVEEEIYNEDNENLFYLHFQIANLLQCSTLFEEFYKVLLNYVEKPTIKVILCCSGGLTTSLFSIRLQELSDLHGYSIKFDAQGIQMLSNVYKDYDAVFLAPQIAYKVPSTIKTVKNKIPVEALNTADFATNNFSNVLDAIVNTLERTHEL